MTGEPTLLLKVKTRNTQSLQRLISSVRSLSGVERTETNIFVLSTLVEHAGVGSRSLRGEAERDDRADRADLSDRDETLSAS